eukprot:140399_1
MFGDLSNCVDIAFIKRHKNVINKRNQCQFDSSRFEQEHNKFTIQIAKDENTRIDKLIQLLKNDKYVTSEIIYELQTVMKHEEFDSDALFDDILGEYQDSNISCLLQNKKCTESVKSYLQTIKLTEASFSSGFCFFYWKWYGNKDNQSKMISGQKGWNRNDFGGYSIEFLYQNKSKHKSFKEEILQYGDYLFTMTDFNDILMLKTNKYLASKEVKSMKSYGGPGAKPIDYLHYEIPPNSPITSEHLQSIILYTDFSALCTDFTSTFRKNNIFETEISIKKRNAKYLWFSRRLRESVEYFGGNWWSIGEYGQTKEWKSTGEEPFYCGMSFCLVMPQYDIRLFGPVSTSRQLEVAINFAKRDGMIIQLQNDTYNGHELQYLNVSWISHFAEEAERLFMGGERPIRVQSVRIIETHHNYHNFFQVLFLFDAMLSGYEVGEKCKAKDSKNNLDMMLKLVSFGNEIESSKQIKYDTYIYDTFDLFCIQKATITINMHYLHIYFPKLSKLIFKKKVSKKRNNLVDSHGI